MKNSFFFENGIDLPNKFVKMELREHLTNKWNMDHSNITEIMRARASIDGKRFYFCFYSSLEIETTVVATAISLLRSSK